MLFLFRLLDGSYSMVSRMEEEVPLVFKALRYPFGISKTGLTAVGSPHTWPALLASIAWLLELLEYDQRVRESEEDGEGAGGDERFFFNYLQSSYAAFLSGDDDAFESLDSEIADTFGAKHDEIREETDAARRESETLRAELTRLQSKGEELPAAQSRRDDFLSDREKFLKLISDLEAHRDALQSKLDASIEEADAAEAAADEAEAEVGHLQDTLEHQEMSVEDVRQTEERREYLQQQAKAAVAKREQAQRASFEAGMEVQRAIEGLQASVEEYHRTAAELRLLPPDDKHAKGTDFEVEVNPSAIGAGVAESLGASLGASGVGGILASARKGGGGGRRTGGGRESLAASLARDGTAGLLGRDIGAEVLPALRELKQSFLQRAHDAKTEALELQDEAEQVSESTGDVTRRAADLEKRVRSLEDSYRRERSALETHLTGGADEMEQLEQNILSARNDLDDKGGEAKGVGGDARSRFEKETVREQEAMEAERRDKEETIYASMMAIASHKERLEGVLDAARGEAAARVDEALRRQTTRVRAVLEAAKAPFHGASHGSAEGRAGAGAGAGRVQSDGSVSVDVGGSSSSGRALAALREGKDLPAGMPGGDDTLKGSHAEDVDHVGDGIGRGPPAGFEGLGGFSEGL